MSSAGPASGSIAVIVVSRDGGARLSRLLGELDAQLGPEDELILSIAGPWALLPDADPVWRDRGEGRFFIVQSPVPVHYGHAVVAAVASARAELLLILNDDLQVEQDLIPVIRAALVGDPYQVVQPRILLAGTGSTPRIENVGHALFLDGLNWARGRGRPDGPAFQGADTVGAVSGAAFALTRSLWDQLNGFDLSLDAFGEDADLSFRALRAGARLSYLPQARVWHELGATYGRTGFRKACLVERNRLLVAVRSLPVTLLLAQPLTVPLRWTLLAIGAKSDDPRRDPGLALAAMAGLIEGLALTPRALLKRRADRKSWRLGELDMLRHTIDQRVHLRDLILK